jgi:hypothetical protein
VQYFGVIRQYFLEAEALKPKKCEVFVTRICNEVIKPFDEFVVTKISARFSNSLAEFVHRRKSAQHGQSEVSRTAAIDDLSKLDQVEFCMCHVVAKDIPKRLVKERSFVELELVRPIFFRVLSNSN